VRHPPGVDLGDDRPAHGVEDEPGFGAALAGFDGHGVGDAFGLVPVGGGADVPAGQGVLSQSFPRFFLDLEPEPFRDALLYPADKDGGGVDAFDAGLLVGGEYQDSLLF
jgi:hypothetical protein